MNSWNRRYLFTSTYQWSISAVLIKIKGTLLWRMLQKDIFRQDLFLQRKQFWRLYWFHWCLCLLLSGLQQFRSTCLIYLIPINFIFRIMAVKLKKGWSVKTQEKRNRLFRMYLMQYIGWMFMMRFLKSIKKEKISQEITVVRKMHIWYLMVHWVWSTSSWNRQRITPPHLISSSRQLLI